MPFKHLQGDFAEEKPLSPPSLSTVLCSANLLLQRRFIDAVTASQELPVEMFVAFSWLDPALAPTSLHSAISAYPAGLLHSFKLVPAMYRLLLILYPPQLRQVVEEVSGLPALAPRFTACAPSLHPSSSRFCSALKNRLRLSTGKGSQVLLSVTSTQQSSLHSFRGKGNISKHVNISDFHRWVKATAFLSHLVFLNTCKADTCSCFPYFFSIIKI